MMSRFRSVQRLTLLVGVVVILSAQRASSAADRWPDERTAGQFVCHADFSLDGYGELVAELARLQRDLTDMLGVPATREPIHLFLFAKQSTYEQYLKRYFPNVPYRRALFIKGRGPGMVFAHLNDGFEVDVRHESTHALLHAALPAVPFWLDEGLAEYFEERPAERAFDNPHLKKLRWDLLFRSVDSLDELARIRDLKDMGRSEYRHSWAWVHFLLHGPGEAREELLGYLSDVHNGVPTRPLDDRLRRRLPDLDGKLADHFGAWKQ